MAKQVKFDNHYIHVAKRVTTDKWYDVIREWDLGYILEDDSGLQDDFPKVWIKEVREV